MHSTVTLTVSILFMSCHYHGSPWGLSQVRRNDLIKYSARVSRATIINVKVWMHAKPKSLLYYVTFSFFFDCFSLINPPTHIRAWSLQLLCLFLRVLTVKWLLVYSKAEWIKKWKELTERERRKKTLTYSEYIIKGMKNRKSCAFCYPVRTRKNCRKKIAHRWGSEKDESTPFAVMMTTERAGSSCEGW